MKKVFHVALAALACMQGTVEAKTSVLTILSFNDIYTIVEDHTSRGGFAELMTLLEEERAQSTHHITTVNGDFLFPCILSIYDKGAHRIDLFNDMKVDVVSVGNHEFDYGPDVVLQRFRESKFPWFAANALGLDGKPFTGDQQSMIVDVDGIKVGLFGLITCETPQLSSTENRVCFSPLVYTSEQMISELKEQGADVIVALTHLLISEDLQLAKEVPQIHVILGGHDHDPITWYDDETFVHKSGQNGYYLLRLDLVMDKDEETGRVSVFPDWKMLLNKGRQRHPEVASKVDAYEKTLDAITSIPIGVMGMDCNTFNGNVRSKETEIGNLFANALRDTFHADCALLGGGLIRGNRAYKKGDMINLKSLLTEIPFGNIVVMVEVPGKAILDALENGVSQVEGRAGRFPQVSGIEFTYDTAKPPGQRISGATIHGRPIYEKKSYKVATVDYILNGGDDYTMFKEGKILVSPLKAISLVDVITDYIKPMDEIVAPLENRIKRVASKNVLDTQNE